MRMSYREALRQALRDALAALYGVPDSQLLATRGSDEGIDLLLRDAKGQRVRYTGDVAQYSVPSAMACVVCHGSDRSGEGGAVPIGPKARFLNRLNPRLGNQNQLQFMKAQGMLTGLPTSMAAVERVGEGLAHR